MNGDLLTGLRIHKMYKICKLDKPKWLQGSPSVLYYAKNIGDDWLLTCGCHAFSEYASWYPILSGNVRLEAPFTHFSIDYSYFNWTEDS